MSLSLGAGMSLAVVVLVLFSSVSKTRRGKKKGDEMMEGEGLGGGERILGDCVALMGPSITFFGGWAMREIYKPLFLFSLL